MARKAVKKKAAEKSEPIILDVPETVIGKEQPAPVREFKLPKKEKVAIVGCADSREQTPWHREAEFEYWGVNNLYLTTPGPWTRWFDIHSFKQDPITKKWLRRGNNDFRGMPVEKYLADMQALDIPVYMQKPVSLVPNAVLYPIKDIMLRFEDYFTNTVSYEIALAIMSGFKEIWILGVDMAVDTEYYWQRPSCEYFIGLARGLGITVYLPDECDLLKTRFLYGYHEEMELAFSKKVKSMRKSMLQRQNKAFNQLEMAKKQLEQYAGAISAASEIEKIWSNTVDLWPDKAAKKKSDGFHGK